MRDGVKKVHLTIEIIAEEDCIEGLISDMIDDAACMDGVEGVQVIKKTEVDDE